MTRRTFIAGLLALSALSACSLDTRTRINVKDYGAEGDGETDDTLAIWAAMDEAIQTGLPLYFPPGNYAIRSRLKCQ